MTSRKHRISSRKKYKSLESWFWANTHLEGGCLVWQGAKHKDGYGYFWRSGKQILTHRYAMELRLEKPLPRNRQVNHTCDNPPCVIHIYLGTQTDNIRDMDTRNRRGRLSGVDNPNAKLTPEDVVAIRRLSKDGLPQSWLAAQFGVTQVNISSIVLRKSWKNL